MDFIVKDIEKYERAVGRAKALNLVEYVPPLERVVIELNVIKNLDEQCMKSHDTR